MKFTAQDIRFMAAYMNCLISRQPFVVQLAKGPAEIDLKLLLSLLPPHRLLLVAGKIPEWVRHLPGRPHELPTDNLNELKECVQEALEEERTGSRPVQFVFFGITTAAYERLLKFIPKGWVATAENLEAIRGALPAETEAGFYENSEGSAALSLGRQEPMDFECNFFKRASGRSRLSVSFLAQKKLAELHLAASAIVGDLERFTEMLTLPELETFFEMDQLTVSKLFDLIQADHSLDIRPYVLLPDSEAVAKVRKLLLLPHLIAVGVVAKGCLVHVHRLRIVADLNVHGILKQVGKAYADLCALPVCRKNPAVLIFPDGHIVIAAHHAENVYVALMTEEAKYNVATEAIAGALNKS